MLLQEKIEEILKSTEGKFGISMKHLESGEEVNINENDQFQMASVFKVPILLTLFDQIHKGKIDLGDRITITKEDHVPGSGVFQEMDPGVSVTIKDLATMMIIVSDNLATDILYRMLGKETIQKTMTELGLEKTTIAHSCWELLCLTVGMETVPYSEDNLKELTARLYSDEDYDSSYVLQEDKENNVCTPKEMTRLFELLANGEFVSEKCSNEVIDVMLRQQLSQRIPGRLPFGTKVAHKTGTIASAANDAGIVYLPDSKGTLIISVFSVGNSRTYIATEVISRISEIAFNHFVGEPAVTNV